MSYAVVILSKRPRNLVRCLRSLKRHEPGLTPDRVLVVHDGARSAMHERSPVGARRLDAAVTWIAGDRPFVYARNANLGIAAAGDRDVVLLNDDARLATPGGLTALASMARVALRCDDYGIISPAIRPRVGNLNQRLGTGPPFREEADFLCFVCVAIPRLVLDEIGPLDERFAGYGFDDVDYCTRTIRAGFRLGIWEGCVVDHGHIASTFGSEADPVAWLAENRRRYDEKWKATDL